MKFHVWVTDISQVDPFRQFVRIIHLANQVSWSYQITVHHDHMSESGVPPGIIADAQICHPEKYSKNGIFKDIYQYNMPERAK